MAKVKISKKSTSVDMTAMCDVAFLLLTFFIMTSTARLPEPYPVDTPASTVQTKLPDTNLATITVGEDNNVGRVYFGMVDKEVRKETLRKMGEKYGINFREDELDAFALIDGFGVDIRMMSILIALKGEDRNKPGVQQGIPYDSTNNQLREWILFARQAARDKYREDLSIAIKGDAETQYPVIQKVIAILQDQKKNNFFLVTGLRTDDF